MARIRTIKPEFFRHESLFEAEQKSGLPLRLAFVGLWTASDREGRFRWQPRQLKLDCLPYDEVNFGEILDALEHHGFVAKYTEGGETYGCIPSWNKHQHVNTREAQSTIPAMHVHGTETHMHARAGNDGGKGKKNEPKKAKKQADSDPAHVENSDTTEPTVEEAQEQCSGACTDMHVHARGEGVLGKESLDLEDSVSKEECASHTRRAREGPILDKPSQVADWPTDYREQFEAAYPHKVAMAVGLKALDEAKRTGKVPFDVVMGGVAAYANKTDDRQWANPRTWITEERWNDRPAQHTNNKEQPADRALRLIAEDESRGRTDVGRTTDQVGGDEVGGDHARIISSNKYR